MKLESSVTRIDTGTYCWCMSWHAFEGKWCVLLTERQVVRLVCRLQLGTCTKLLSLLPLFATCFGCDAADNDTSGGRHTHC